MPGLRADTSHFPMLRRSGTATLLAQFRNGSAFVHRHAASPCCETGSGLSTGRDRSGSSYPSEHRSSVDARAFQQQPIHTRCLVLRVPITGKIRPSLMIPEDDSAMSGCRCSSSSTIPVITTSRNSICTICIGGGFFPKEKPDRFDQRHDSIFVRTSIEAVTLVNGSCQREESDFGEVE